MNAVDRGAGAVLEFGPCRRAGACSRQRPVFGADGVVGRDDAGLAVARKLCAIDEIEDRSVAAEVQNEPAPGAFDALVLEAAGAAQDRRDRCERGDRLRQLRLDEYRLAVLAAGNASARVTSAIMRS